MVNRTGPGVLLRRDTGIDGLGDVSRPYIPIQMCNRYRFAVGQRDIAMHGWRISGDADGRSRRWHRLCPGETAADRSPVLIVLNRIAVRAVQHNEAAEKCRTDIALDFRTGWSIRMTDVACQKVVVGRSVNRTRGSGQRIGHHVSDKIRGARDIAAKYVVRRTVHNEKIRRERVIRRVVAYGVVARVEERK